MTKTNNQNSVDSSKPDSQDTSHLVDNHSEETTEGPVVENQAKKPALIQRDSGLASVPRQRRGNEEGFYFPRR